MFKKSFFYILINYMMQAMNILLNLIFMKYLTGGQLGSLSLARTWQQSIDYSHLGTRFSLDRFIPTSGDEEKKRLLCTVIVATFVISFLLFLVSVFISGNDLVIVVFNFVGIILAATNVIKSYLRACGLVDRMLKMVVIAQLMPVTLSTVYYCISKDFSGYLLVYFLSFFIFFMMFYITERKLICEVLTNYKFVLSTLKDIVRPSFLLFVNSLFIFLYMVMDRFFIDHYLGRSALGNYSVITFAFSALMIIPASCAELIFSRVVRQSALKKKKVYIKESMLCLGITLIGVVCANIFMGFFIREFTHYDYLLDLMHLATFAVIPFSLTAIYYHVLNGHDLRNKMIGVSFTVCVFQVVYYFFLAYTEKMTITNVLYAKLATGWIVILAYFLVLLLSIINKRT